MTNFRKAVLLTALIGVVGAVVLFSFLCLTSVWSFLAGLLWAGLMMPLFLGVLTFFERATNRREDAFYKEIEKKKL